MPEANFDGIVGPTHNYAGLSPGNVASTANQGAVSRPRDAALQGLAKAAALARLGLVQGWLPLWLPLIGSALVLQAAQRLLPALRP